MSRGCEQDDGDGGIHLCSFVQLIFFAKSFSCRQKEARLPCPAALHTAMEEVKRPIELHAADRLTTSVKGHAEGAGSLIRRERS